MRGAALIEASIDLIDPDGYPIIESGGQLASRKVQIMRDNDKYKAILGDGNARVNVGLDESIGGPYGYSSVKIRMSVTLTCDQNAESVQQAKQYCFDECMDFIEGNLGIAHKMLVDHLERFYVKEG